MNTAEILSAIDEELTRLEQARALLGGAQNGPAKAAIEGKRRGRPPGAAKQVPGTETKTRTMSEEGRARIAAAQKARWAAKKKAEKKAAKASISAIAAKKIAAPAKKTAAKEAAVKQTVLKKAAVSTKPGAVKKAAPAVKKVASKKVASQVKAPAKTVRKTSAKARIAAGEVTHASLIAETGTGAAPAAESVVSE